LSASSAASPIPTPASFWGWLPAGLKAQPPLTIGAGAALLLVLVLVLALVVRAVKKPKPGLVDDTTMVLSESSPPVTEVTSVPERLAPVLAWLVSLDADSTRHPITKTAVRIGRKQDNDLVMKNDSVSSHHAEILKRGDKFIIADLGASNGVFVSGKRVEKIALENGDIIELGEVRLRFMLNQSDE
ncbi:MAG TPA: FHA domain-containing protein, partial [Chthoniobacterales bacterium]|nr:FHA domain-containing protein [Chthoniobacterales bacterium]